MESFVITKIFSLINCRGENMIHEICHHGCVSLLLRVGCWLTQTNKFLLQQYDYEGHQCVHIVAKRHRQQHAVLLMEFLMELGADLNGRDICSGDTALHIAVYHQDHELITWLCQQTDVDLEACNYAGLSAYQVAWKRDDLKAMDIFFKYDADCDQPYSSESETSDYEC